jgi:D-alanyl-D-alanine-carboxypeptidase/D-alanyl-D-alanine-endopeptidase
MGELALNSLKLILATTAFSCVSLLVQPQTIRMPTENARAVRAAINDAVSQFFKDAPQAVGLSIGVVKDGEVYTFNYGTVEKRQARSPSADTEYPIASITKTFTGALLAQAALEKRVNLDDDLRKYLNGEYPNLEFEGHPIRLYDLLDHRSGLPFFLPDTRETQPDSAENDVPWTARISEQTKGYSKEDFFADLHKVKLTFIPGEKFSYSNAGAQLMGYILERVYGKPYEALLKEKILGPLKMYSTAITLDSRQKDRLARGYDDKGRLMPEIAGQLQGAGALKSSVNDMLKYAQWQMAEKSEAAKLSHKPQFTSGNYSAGLNWQIIRSGSDRLIWQEGNIDGFNSLCLLEPERRLGLVILANEEDRLSAHYLSVMTNEILKELDGDAILLP